MMQPSQMKTLAPAALALLAGLAIGHYAIPSQSPVAAPVVAPDDSGAPQTLTPEDSTAAPIVTPSEPSSIATAESVPTEILDLKKKLETAEKELKDFREAARIEPVYDEPEVREKLANELLDLTNSKEQIESAFGQSAEMILKDNKDPEKKQALTALFNKYFSWDVIGPEFVRIYTEVFSAEDLQRINKFYQSDSGRLMLDKQPALMGKTMEVMQKLNEKNLPKMMEELTKIIPPKDPKAAPTREKFAEPH